MGNFKRLGNFEDKLGEKEANLVGEAAYIRPLQTRDFLALYSNIITSLK
jgi:hypothetical protein